MLQWENDNKKLGSNINSKQHEIQGEEYYMQYTELFHTNKRVNQPEKNKCIYSCQNIKESVRYRQKIIISI